MVKNPLLILVERVHTTFREMSEGEPASYIPELAGANLANCGVVIATVDGVVYCAGDTARDGSQ